MPPSPGEPGPVVLLGLRGTFEPFDSEQRGLGPTVDALAARVASAMVVQDPPLEFEAIGIDYPATAISYWHSRTQGALQLTSAAEATVRRAPACALVLAGLSQGADALRRALATPAMQPLYPRIAAVVLLGDPTRRPDEGAWHYGTQNRAAGLLARWSTPIPATLRARTWSFCLDDDRIAANTTGMRAVWRSGSHTEYEANACGALDLGAAFVVEQLDQRSNP